MIKNKQQNEAKPKLGYIVFPIGINVDNSFDDEVCDAYEDAKSTNDGFKKNKQKFTDWSTRLHG